jgi:hypothetical protein
LAICLACLLLRIRHQSLEGIDVTLLLSYYRMHRLALTLHSMHFIRSPKTDVFVGIPKFPCCLLCRRLGQVPDTI